MRNVRKFVSLYAFLSLPAVAAETQFHIDPILIQGDDNVQATGINDSSVIVATLYANITDIPSGIIINGTTVTTLPLPGQNFSALYPKSINNAGDIFGWARGRVGGDAQSFLLHDGAYVPAYQKPVIEPGTYSDDFVPQFMGLTATDEVFFNTIVSLSGPVLTQYGKPPHYKSSPREDRFNVILSINNAGTIASTSYSFSGIHQLFVGKNNSFAAIVPPGSVNTLGGSLNNHGDVAGSYLDAQRQPHGFVFHNGAYKSFEIPEGANSIATTAINDNGRVAGSYVDTSNRQAHAFLYNGTTTSSFGSYEAADNVTTILDNQGVMVVTRQLYNPNGPVYQSFRVRCEGSGC